LSSCFAHAISLAQRAFITALSPKKKTASDDEDGCIELDKEEETEEEVHALLEEVEAVIAALPPNSEESRLLTSLLLKVRGFIAKVYMAVTMQS
jgi:hypothetical protein